MQTPYGGRSLVKRLLGGAVLLLIAALALRWAVELVMSIIGPLLGIGAVVLLVVIGHRVWRAGRDSW